ncbi:hypothetical protein [Shewanella sp.]
MDNPALPVRTRILLAFFLSFALVGQIPPRAGC